MQNRLNQNDVSNHVNVESATQVRDAVLEIFTHRYPAVDFAQLVRAFDDVQALFEGRYPGFLACDTLYHDIRHTLDMTLAMARLVDGHDRICAPQDRLGARRAVLGVIIALLHDSGYMKRTSESNVENGAIFTKVHVTRSSEFLANYLPTAGFVAEATAGSQIVHYTGYEMNIEDIPVEHPKDRLLGCMVGTADLIGQMSDRLYLEKCRDFLYQEFVYGQVARETLSDGRELVRYSSPEDLIIKTPGFYEYVARTRIREKLDGVDDYAAAHFDGPNLYTLAIEGNFSHLREVLETADFNRLRRLCYSLSNPVRRAA